MALNIKLNMKHGLKHHQTILNLSSTFNMFPAFEQPPFADDFLREIPFQAPPAKADRHVGTNVERTRFLRRDERPNIGRSKGTSS